VSKRSDDNISGVALYFLFRSYHVNSKGKAIFITGCDTGFGYQLALKARSSGFVVLAGIYGDGSEEGATNLTRNGCHVIHLDVTKQKDVDEAAIRVDQLLEEEDAYLWAVVNNAGIALHCELEWCTAEDMHRILDVNSVGPFRVAKALLPALRRSHVAGTRIVNVASAAAYFTFPGLAGYSMSKHACRSLSDGMRREWKKFGILVSCIEPTLYKTNICNTDNLIKRLRENWSQLSAATKACYGSGYLNDYENKIINRYQKAGRTQIWEVTDSIMDAITNMEPKRHYHPGIVPRFRLFLFRLFPEWIVDKLTTSLTHMPAIKKQ